MPAILRLAVCIPLPTYCINASLSTLFWVLPLESHTLQPKGTVGQYVVYLFIIYCQINYLSPKHQLYHESTF